MDPIEMLIEGAIQHEVLQNKNPYLTMETIIMRLYKKIFEYTRVSYNYSDKTLLFSQWHEEILNSYECIKSNLSYEERACVERILSKDCPHSSELIKFACCWYKHDPITACKWFAVDGIIGTHPKAYVQDAFSTSFEKHNSAVRVLYNYYTNPDNIKYIVSKALSIQKEKNCPLEFDPEFDKCVELYIEMVGKDEMERVALDRQAKLQSQQQPSKRKKKALPDSLQPISPTPSPQNL